MCHGLWVPCDETPIPIEAFMMSELVRHRPRRSGISGFSPSILVLSPFVLFSHCLRPGPGLCSPDSVSTVRVPTSFDLYIRPLIFDRLFQHIDMICYIHYIDATPIPFSISPYDTNTGSGSTSCFLRVAFLVWIVRVLTLSESGRNSLA